MKRIGEPSNEILVAEIIQTEIFNPRGFQASWIRDENVYLELVQ